SALRNSRFSARCVARRPIFVAAARELVGGPLPRTVLGGQSAGMIPTDGDPMSGRFEELAWQPTPMGELSLRRRRDPVLGADVYEVKLDDDYLMSSMFTAAEVEIAHLALARLARDDGAVDGARRSRP